VNKVRFILALATAGIVIHAQAPTPARADIFVCCNNNARPIKTTYDQSANRHSE
jgi:hypothetical protein